MASCIFCDKDKMRGDVTYDFGNFFVKVGFSLVAPGHSMLISNTHYPCFGDLPNELEEEFEEQSNRLQKIITEQFYEPFQLEYGSWGQSVFHAHTHFIPLQSPDYRVESIIEEMVKPENIDFEEVDRAGLKSIYREEGGYVSVREKGRLYLLHTKGKVFDHNIHSNKGYRYNAFFTLKKGLDIPGWLNMKEKHKAVDEERRSITKRVLSVHLAQI